MCNCLEEAPSKCLNKHCKHAEVFKDKLLCTLHNKWFDLTPVEKENDDLIKRGDVINLVKRCKDKHPNGVFTYENLIYMLERIPSARKIDMEKEANHEE